MRPRGGRSGGSKRSGTKEDRPDRVGDVLPTVIRKLGLTEEVGRQKALIRWEGVVGERIAAVTRATAVSRGVLFVRVASSAWLMELNLMRHDILQRLNAGRGKERVERIVFTLSEESDPPSERRKGGSEINP